MCQLDLLLRHYRGAFDRIYLYSRSATLDRGWAPLRKYVEEVQHVNQDDEPTFFDEFDAKGGAGADGPPDARCRVRQEGEAQRDSAGSVDF